MSESNTLFRIIFTQGARVYELYSRYICEDSLLGFVEVEELVFSSAKTSIIVDPSEEKLKAEFKGVEATYIPVHAVLRIDEVKKVGAAKIKDLNGNPTNISKFPGAHQMEMKRDD